MPLNETSARAALECPANRVETDKNTDIYEGK